MQENYSREHHPIANRKRAGRTQIALKAAMRALVLEKGYSEAATPQIVERAGVTRGALYHHYKDKKDLFRAVVEDECAAVAAQIRGEGGRATDPLSALKAGANAYIQAMVETGRTRLLLVEGPAVLGRAELQMIEDRYTRGSLLEGLREAAGAGAIKPLPLQALFELLNAMFDGASLCIEAGVDIADVRVVVDAILEGIVWDP